MHISSKVKRLTKWSAACAAVMTLVLPATASAASIELTGPGSLNLISSSNRSLGDSSIFLTGPDSVNVIRSSGNNHHKSWNGNWDWQNNGSWNWWNSMCGHQNNSHIVKFDGHNNDWSSSHNQVWMSNWDWNNSWNKKHNSVHHHNHIDHSHINRSFTQRNDTDVNVHNSISQSARSGNVTASHNTVVGDVSSGDVSNSASNEVNVDVSNGSGGGSWANTWSNQWNSRRASFSRTNDTDVNVSNTINQHATSGNVTVSHNTVVGDVSSGSASNWAENIADISINN